MAGRLPLAWGATAHDLLRDYPADRLLAGRTLPMTRAVAVAAPTELLWLWLCQVAVAPYSYDLLDNRGRRSPQDLTPGAADLEVGQLMTVFRLTGFEAGRQWTGLTTPSASRLFGPVAVTYAAEPGASGGSRLVCRIVVEVDGTLARLRAPLLAWGDLVMMRRQLRNLKHLAERDARRLAAG